MRQRASLPSATRTCDAAPSRPQRIGVTGLWEGAGGASPLDSDQEAGKLAEVAFLGLGVMGYPMAGHLQAKGGHRVRVYNRTRAKAEQWVAQFGGGAAATPRMAAGGCDFVFACVGADDDLRAIALGDDGAFAGMKPGAIFVDHTTASA